MALQVLLQVVGGLGVFLLGMRFMSEGMQNAAGDRLRRMIAAVTNNRLSGVTVGLTITCLIQSSSVTTVMVVGLVNGGVMTLKQAIGVIFGANIGTTITGWILVLKIGKYGLPILGAAALVYLFSRREYVRYVAMAIMGIGMIFFGLEIMKDGFRPIQDDPDFVDWFQRFDAGTYFGVLKCVLAGCVLTCIVQSSSATLGITISLAYTGMIGFQSAAALILGENIGTTITALLASLGTGTNARRTAYAHSLFNVLGVIWITSVFFPYLDLIRYVLGGNPEVMVPLADGTASYPSSTAAIALVHTGFNVTNTLLFLPFVQFLERFLVRVVPDRERAKTPRLTELEGALLLTPEIAIERSRAEVRRMGRIVLEMMDLLKIELTAPRSDEKRVSELFHREEVLDALQHEVSVFLSEILTGRVTRQVSAQARQQLRIADEYESMSDHLAQILKLHLRLQKSEAEFPKPELVDILELHDAVRGYLGMVMDAVDGDDREIVTRARPRSEALTFKVRDIRNRNLDRITESRQKPLIIMLFSDMLSDYRRVKAHGLNVAEVIAGEK